ncbi:MAG: hypothetical protein CMO34_05365 [Verrucomicrobia bacterium]|nr:hypothetical protein [Verrucomicrobiota bacterium]|tara:strand:+ start:803 stop:1177 length:375 start_codon:yes stop_codon:yes gene_type:complete
MEPLIIEPYLQTPEVNFNPNSGNFSIIGKAYPADAIEFFEPIIDYCNNYIKDAAPSTILSCEIEYLNSASQKQVIELIQSLKPLIEQGKEFIVHWLYEEGDDDLLSVGELIEHELEVPFVYKEV